MRLHEHLRLVREFAEGHLRDDEDHDYHIRLKLEHSMRVLDNGVHILREEGITGRTADLATMAALYHDIGRFPQFDRWGTYRDADSVNHGRMGVLTLRRLDLGDDFTPRELRLIRAAVGLHNAKEVNPALRDPLATLVQVTRDADKADIFHVILDHLSQPHNPNRVVIHKLKEDPARFTPAVLETVSSGMTCDYASLRYANDFVLLIVGWVFSLSYRATERLLLSRGLVDKAFGLLPEDAGIDRLRTKVMAHLQRS
ncbi:MAG: HD domain-containing protein [Pseudodesulfovibrio sp.]|uniref:HD domain-containing protein n=1 Tax=Pseudodesulfovibrio sp. TaxID=2035812 RepID=UPI003D0CDBD6